MPDETFLKQVIATVSEVMPDLGAELRLLTRDEADEQQAVVRVADHLEEVLSTPLRSAFELSAYLQRMELDPSKAIVEVREHDVVTREPSVSRYRLVPDLIVTERQVLQRAVRSLDAFTATVRGHFSGPDPRPDFRQDGGATPRSDPPLPGQPDTAQSQPSDTPYSAEKKTAVTAPTSPINQALALGQLKKALGLIKQTKLSFNGAAPSGAMPPVGKLYEAWAMLRLAHDVVRYGHHAAHATIAWNLSDGTPAKYKHPVIFRGSPARLRRAHRDDEPGYLSLDNAQGPVLEIHSSLQFDGWSGAGHELDLAVTKSSVMETWWEDAATPSWTGLDYIAALELKCHARSTDVGLVRQAALTRLDLLAKFGEGYANWPLPPLVALPPARYGSASLKMHALHMFVSTQPLTDAGELISDAYGLVHIAMAPGQQLSKDVMNWWRYAMRRIAGHF